MTECLDCAGVLEDLRGFTLPQDVNWAAPVAGWRWLQFVYDWDTITLNNNAAASFTSQLNLCAKHFPCSLQIRGQAHETVEVSRDGQLVCLSSAGCSRISIDSVAFSCRHNSQSIFKVQGSVLFMSNTSFSGCGSNTDGGVVQAFDMATVEIKNCTITDAYSSGFGGAIAAYGSNVSISGSSLHNCFAAKGGGAVWSAMYQSCYGSNQTFNTSLYISISVFSRCNTNGAGGAILADSMALMNGNETLGIVILSSQFSQCTSAAEGGAVRISGAPVIASVSNTQFGFCTSNSSGGAISSSSASLSLVDCTIKDNTAQGIGGGALHLNNSYFSVFETSIFNNRAPRGGGGAIFWQGFVNPSAIKCPASTTRVDSFCAPNITLCLLGTCMGRQGAQSIRELAILSSLCGTSDSSALFGPCIASNYSKLLVSQMIDSIYTGEQFNFTATKQDAYGNTIFSDSSSFLQVIPVTDTGEVDSSTSILGSAVSKLSNGVGSFQFAIQPTFSNIDMSKKPSAIYNLMHIALSVEGVDTESTLSVNMKTLMLVQVMECVAGYAWASSARTCDLCPPGFYCLGGSSGRQACPTGSYSESGASATSFCVASQTTSSSVSQAVVGGAVGGVIFVLGCCVAGYFLLKMWSRNLAKKTFLATISGARAGQEASIEHFPPDHDHGRPGQLKTGPGVSSLRRMYTAVNVLGKGSNGCVVRAKRKDEGGEVAIKIIVPKRADFDEIEQQQLRNEGQLLQLVTSRKCQFAVHAMHSTDLPHRCDVCWFVMEVLEGMALDVLVHPVSTGSTLANQFLPEHTAETEPTPLSDITCIEVTRDILAALKVVHSEGWMHGDVTPANIIRCTKPQLCENSYEYKLIDFGSGLPTFGEDTGTFVPSGASAYRAPELCREPCLVTAAADIWSLGMTMFELVKGHLPFCAECNMEARLAEDEAGCKEQKISCIQDYLTQGQHPIQDLKFSNVVSKALEKDRADRSALKFTHDKCLRTPSRILMNPPAIWPCRYVSADAMHEAVFSCLVARGTAHYSAYLSYRVESEGPLARLIFDELNHR